MPGGGAVAPARRIAAEVGGTKQANQEPDGSCFLAPLRAEIRALLEQCAAGHHRRTANFAAGLRDKHEALWTFADVPDVAIEPANNAAERAVRHAMVMRKIQGGTQSERGSRWIEGIRSARETCRLRRPVLDWLTQAATAAHHGRAVPSLLAAPAAQGP